MIYKKLEEIHGLLELDGKQQHEFNIINIRDGWAECKIYYRNKPVMIISIPIDAPVGKLFRTSGHAIKILRQEIIK